MKNKLLKLALSFVLCLSMGTTVMAAQSPTVDNSGATDNNAPSAPPSSAEITFEAADGTAMSWISSEQNGNISVSGSEGNIPEGAVFDAARISSGNELIHVANAVANAKGDVSYVAYDFNLRTAGGTPITRFDGHVDVSIPIPAEFTLEDGKVVSVYYVADDGNLERCNSVVSGNFVTFGTNHFSTFVYIEETAASAASTPVVNTTTSPKTAETNMGLYMAMLAVAALCVVVYGTRKEKYNR